MSIVPFIIIGIIALLVLYIAMIVIKEHIYSQRATKHLTHRKEDDDYNRWLHRIGLQETAYYFNPSGIRILSDWLMWKKDVLK